jgi:hypothetical protein
MAMQPLVHIVDYTACVALLTGKVPRIEGYRRPTDNVTMLIVPNL